MIRFLGFLTLSVMISTLAIAQQSRQLYEVRSYVIGESGDPAAIDAYLEKALVPAVGRMGLGPIGVFGNAPSDESGSQRIIVVIPVDSADDLAKMNQKLAADQQYQADAKDYLAHGPENSPYQRIESELLVAMDCMTQAKVPEGLLENSDRVYELRVYESANERLGNVKVDMFNAGEVPIFFDCGIIPIFIGQAVVGPQTPSLTYLTTYPSEKERLEAWKKFRVNPDWKVLSAKEIYQGTVSRIDKYVLVAKSYSKM